MLGSCFIEVANDMIIGLISSPQAFCLSACFRGTPRTARFLRLIAALRSRSCTAPQSQVHSLSDNFSSALMQPQCRHKRDDGKNLSASSNSAPYQAVLYSNCLSLNKVFIYSFHPIFELLHTHFVLCVVTSLTARDDIIRHISNA